MVAAQGDAVRGHHPKAVVRDSLEHAEVQGSAAEVHREQALALGRRVGVQKTHRRADGLGIEARLRNTGVVVGLAEPRQGELVSMFVTAFKIDRMADAAAVDLADLGSERPLHAQQDGRDQGDQSERMVEHHQTANVRLAEQALGPAEQATTHAGVRHGVAVDIDGQGLAGIARTRARVADRQRRPANHLRHQFDLSPRVVVDIATDGIAPGSRLQGAIDIRGRRHDLGVVLQDTVCIPDSGLQSDQGHRATVEDRRHGVARAEVDADADAVGVHGALRP